MDTSSKYFETVLQSDLGPQLFPSGLYSQNIQMHTCTCHNYGKAVCLRKFNFCCYVIVTTVAEKIAVCSKIRHDN